MGSTAFISPIYKCMLLLACICVCKCMLLRFVSCCTVSCCVVLCCIVSAYSRTHIKICKSSGEIIMMDGKSSCMKITE